MGKVRYSELASRDVCEHAEYISRDKPDATYRWIDTIEGVCEMLAQNPEMGHARKTKNHGACRSFTSGNYVVFFRGFDDGVEIIRIVQGERDLDHV